MSLALEVQHRAVRFEFSGLPSYTREEAALTNWLCRFFPYEADWRQVLGEVFAGLIERRTSTTIRLVETSEIEHKRETREYQFEKNEILIGRNPSNDVVLAANSIGREHARIFARDGSFQIEDLGSSLGTWVNQKRLEPKQRCGLNNGDVIGTFPYTLTFEAQSKWEPETQVQFEFTPARLQAWDEFSLSSPVGCANYDLAIHPGQGAVRVQADRSFLVRLIARALRDHSAGALLAADSGVIEFLLLSILEKINRRVSLPFQFSLQPARHNPPVTARGLNFSLTLGLADVTGFIRIFIPLEVISGMREKAPALRLPDVLQQVSWPLTISAGNVEFTPDELSSLDPGDVVLFATEPELLFPPNLAGSWKGQFTSATPWQFKVVQYFEERSLLMDQGSNPTQPQGAPDLTQLPVRLHVVLGQVDLSLAEISSMVSGTVLELDKGKNDPVHLAVNGKILGSGELVEIDGKLGVRITGWSGA